MRECKIHKQIQIHSVLRISFFIEISPESFRLNVRRKLCGLRYDYVYRKEEDIIIIRKEWEIENAHTNTHTPSIKNSIRMKVRQTQDVMCT